MKNLTTGIMTLFNATTGGLHNDFYNDVGGRLFKSRVPMGTLLPYATFKVVTDTQDDTFKDTIDEVLIQFTLISGSSSTSELEDMYTHLKAFIDDKQFTVTGNTVVMMVREQGIFSDLPADSELGTDAVFMYDVDYRCILQKV